MTPYEELKQVFADYADAAGVYDQSRELAKMLFMMGAARALLIASRKPDLNIWNDSLCAMQAENIIKIIQLNSKHEKNY